MQRARERFQSTPSVGRATSNRQSARPRLSISIHALREEGDPPSGWMVVSNRDFNPRSPWGERREQEIIIRAALEFQSTPSARRATADSLHSGCSAGDFNPRSPWGERPGAAAALLQAACISIHALREESDGRLNICFRDALSISIHALREESDGRICNDICDFRDFNPRPPRGERPARPALGVYSGVFQSTPSARRATQKPERQRIL